MGTFETEMKRAYSEALAPYGFKKLKGRYPYFVRMVGEEILQVITYYNEWAMNPRRTFCMVCGMATVYRGEIDLESSPRDNTSWRQPYREIYMDSHPFCSREDVPKYSFEYEMPDEPSAQKFPREVIPYPLPSMQEAIEHTLDLTKQEIIPVFDTVTDLKTCAKYFHKYDSLCMRMDERSPFDWVLNYREQLFNLKVYNNVDEFSATRLEIYGEETMPSEGLQKQTALFERLLNDPDIHAKALAELERRRQRNTETLRKYGLL